MEIHKISQATWVWPSSPCTDMVSKEGRDICSACTKVHSHPYMRASEFLKLLRFLSALFPPSIQARIKALLSCYSELQSIF